MAESDVDGEELALADYCLARADVTAEELSTDQCRLVFIQGGEEHAVVPIIEINGKVLVAVPFPAWHKKVNRRLLPQTGLTKPGLSS